MSPTLQLLRIIGSPLLPGVPGRDLQESESLFKLAFRNNVEMLYLAALENAGQLRTLRAQRDMIAARQRDTLKTVCRLSSVLQQASIAHAVTKTLRPYPGTPNDIDCLYLGPLDQYEAAGRYLQGQHYRLTGPQAMQFEFFDELSGVDFDKDKTGGRFYIDFYRELAADYMPYMDSDVLRGEGIRQVVDGCDTPVCVLQPRAELTVLALHSVLMHRIMPLEVFYTYAYLLAEMEEPALRDLWVFVRASHAEPAMRTMLTVMSVLHSEAFGTVPDQLSMLVGLSGTRSTEARALRSTDLRMPHVINLSTFVISVFSKTRGKRARRGFFRELAHMANPVFAVEVLYHMLSKKFIDKHSDHV
jgi:hypothetical protein